MKKSNLLKTLTLVIGLITYTASFAQCDTIASLCDQHITSNFISDGQDYRSLLLDDEIAEFYLQLDKGVNNGFNVHYSISLEEGGVDLEDIINPREDCDFIDDKYICTCDFHEGEHGAVCQFDLNKSNINGSQTINITLMPKKEEEGIYKISDGAEKFASVPIILTP